MGIYWGTKMGNCIGVICAMELMIYIGKHIPYMIRSRTRHYQSDFDIDKEMLWGAAGQQDEQDKSFIWLCRTAGTWLLYERDVFLKGTSANNIFNFYAEQASVPVLAFAVKVKRVAADTVIGDIYVLDYQSYHRHIQSVGLSAETVLLQYEHGKRMMGVDAMPGSYTDTEYGELVSLRYLPHEQEDLEDLLWRERQERERYKEGDPDAFTNRLAIQGSAGKKI